MKKILIACILSLFPCGAWGQVSITGTTAVANDGVCFYNTLGQINDCGVAININGVNGISYPAIDTTTDGTIAIGHSALANETAAGAAGYLNTAIGYQAMGVGTMTTAAIKNVALGYQAFQAVTSGTSNVCIGYQACNALTSGSSTTAVGFQACSTASTNGSACTAVGNGALLSSTAQHNTAVGIAAGDFVSSGAENTAVGFDAMLGITGTKITGANNSCFGSTSCKLFQGAAHDNSVLGFNAASLTGFAGFNNTIMGSGVASTTLATGSNNILIGVSSAIDTASGSTANTINIGGTGGSWVLVTGTGTNTTEATTMNGTLSIPNIANTATTSSVCVNTGTGLLTYDGTLGTCTVSDGRFKNIDGNIQNALDKILQIQGVYFHWKDPSMGSGRQAGVVAQDVEKVFPELVNTDSKGTKSVAYEKLTAPLIEAIREQQEEIEALKTANPASHKCFFGLLVCAD